MLDLNTPVEKKVQLTLGETEFPYEFLDLVQKGKVVFFCGAGLSKSTGLPDFPGLVKELDLILNPDPINQISKGRKDHDQVLSELEAQSSSKRMRGFVEKILNRPHFLGTLKNHENILKLAITHNGPVRLVTTNFDNRFKELASKFEIKPCDAPALPPELPREKAFVHLHGRIGTGKPDDLILNTADFGRAYLSEGWARRFVTRLLSQWSVVFIGYGLNDPPMRYLIDAVYDARFNPENFKRAFALVGCEEGEKNAKRKEWENKQVYPILYDIVENDHIKLDKALQDLVELKNDPNYRINLITQDLQGDPGDEDENKGKRVIWALSDIITARKFAYKQFFSSEEDSQRFINWLNLFKEEKLFQTGDTESIDLFSHTAFTHPSKLQLPMPTRGFAYWLSLHIHQSALLWWLARENAPLHPDLVYFLSRSIENYQKNDSPRISRKLLEKWKIFIHEQKTLLLNSVTLRDLYNVNNWPREFRLNMEQKLVSALCPYPKITISSSGKKRETEINISCQLDSAKRLIEHEKRWVECEGEWLSVAGKHVQKPDFLLHYADTLVSYLEHAASLISRYKLSTGDISNLHKDNLDTPHYKVISILVRNGIRKLITLKNYSKLEFWISQWSESNHILLCRMALFAISESTKHHVEIDKNGNFGMIIIEKEREEYISILKNPECFFECLYFLRMKGGNLSQSNQKKIENIICSGRNSSTRSSESGIDITTARYLTQLKYSLEKSGKQLFFEKSKELLFAAHALYPESILTSMQASNSAINEPNDKLPVHWESLPFERCVGYINSSKSLDLVKFANSFPRKLLTIFQTSINHALPDVSKWNALLFGFRQRENISRASSMQLMKIFENLPYEMTNSLVKDMNYCCILNSISHKLSFSFVEQIWHQAWSFKVDNSLNIRDIGGINCFYNASQHLHGQLINIPIEHLKKEQSEIASLNALSYVLTNDIPSYRFGIIVIAGHLNFLFEKYNEWTCNNLLTFFKPDHPMVFEVWEAFLDNLQPDTSQDLLRILKPGLIHCLKNPKRFHYSAYSLFDFFIDMPNVDPQIMSYDEKRQVVSNMNSYGIQLLCWQLKQKLPEIQGNNVTLGLAWKNTVFPFLENVWPEKRLPPDEKSEVSHVLAYLVTLSGNEFQAAFKWASEFLSPIDEDSYLAIKLNASHGQSDGSISSKFPLECLLFLNQIVSFNRSNTMFGLDDALVIIKKRKSKLETHPAFIRLQEIVSAK